MEKSRVTQQDVEDALRRLGLQAGDLVLAHSSLSAFGHVEGGSHAVTQALLAVLGPAGTLVMPTLCQKDRERRFETWDIHHSPSDVGRITEVFRLRPGSLRSDHPTHSVAAIGPLAEAVTAGHAQAGGRPGPWGDAAFAAGSPWQRFYDLDARILFLGVEMRVNTMGHFIEHLLAERNVARAPEERRPAVRAALQGWCKAGAWPAFDRMRLQESLDGMGLLSRTGCGAATLLMVPARPMVDRALALLESQPAAWFSVDCCVWLGVE